MGCTNDSTQTVQTPRRSCEIDPRSVELEKGVNDLVQGIGAVILNNGS